MAGSLNKVMLIGSLGKDPEIRRSQSGDKIANFTIATSENWKDKATGEKREKTEWHRVVVFNPGLSDVIEKYVFKGSKVYLEGKLATRKWQDKEGHDKYTTEIVLDRFDGKLTMLGEPAGARADREDNREHPSNQGHPKGGTDRGGDDLDDEIPF